MVGKLKVSVSGLKELDASLGELSKAAAKGVLTRVLMNAGEPIRDAAKRLAPKGETRQLSENIVVSTKAGTSGDAGKDAYSEIMKSGGTKAQAVSAMRDARRAQGAGDAFAAVYVGPAKSGKRNSIKAIVQEFGSVKQAPQAYLRPAFNAAAGQALDIIRNLLGGEIAKAAARAAKRKAKKAAGG
jgi:HK97 gp10 family phage protein